MKKVLIMILLTSMSAVCLMAQTKQVSQSAALKKGIKTVSLINDLQIKIDFNSDSENLWITGSTKNNNLIITEFIPLSDPSGTNIEIGRSYKLESPFVSIEYKILTIENNRVTRIWYRVAAKMLKLPEESWI